MQSIDELLKNLEEIGRFISTLTDQYGQLNKFDRGFLAGIDKAKYLAKELKVNMEADDGWVEIENNPKESRKYLLIGYIQNTAEFGPRYEGEYTISYFQENGKWNHNYTFKPTHYRELPSPSKGEK